MPFISFSQRFAMPHGFDARQKVVMHSTTWYHMHIHTPYTPECPCPWPLSRRFARPHAFHASYTVVCILLHRIMCTLSPSTHLILHVLDLFNGTLQSRMNFKRGFRQFFVLCFGKTLDDAARHESCYASLPARIAE